MAPTANNPSSMWVKNSATSGKPPARHLPASRQPISLPPIAARSSAESTAPIATPRVSPLAEARARSADPGWVGVVIVFVRGQGDLCGA